MRKPILLTLFMIFVGSASFEPVAAQELVYVPANPCRIVDTRNAGGAITANTFSNFRVSGTAGELAVQGGTTNCLDPKAGTGLKPLAVAAYVVAVPPGPSSGSGVLTAYPSNQPPPPTGSGSTVNFAAGQVIGNTTNITLCDPAGSCPTDGEFAILARNTDQHVVIDVQGYFYPATLSLELLAMIKALEDSVSALEGENNALQAELDNEVSARIAGDSNLEGKNNVLQAALDNEVSARTAGDNNLAGGTIVLQTALDNEVSARIAGDSNLEGKNNSLQAVLDNEVSARIAGDNNLQSEIDGLDAMEIEDRVADLEGRLVCVSGTSTSADIFFEGCNVHVRNGVGTTESINSFGNLIIGYNKERYASDKTGSHNLVVGDEHNYTRFGGLVAGRRNSITGDWASVTGGVSNEAGGIHSSITGGVDNTANGNNSSVSGGYRNYAGGEDSSILGGRENVTHGEDSTVSGGIENSTFAAWASISGGSGGVARGQASSISGGVAASTSITATHSSILGGEGLYTVTDYETIPALP